MWYRHDYGAGENMGTQRVLNEKGTGTHQHAYLH
jgi:hypothetical protein